MPHIVEDTVVCGRCGTEVKSWARICPSCHAVKGVGRVANRKIVGKTQIMRTRIEFAIILIALVVSYFFEVWLGVTVFALAAVAFLLQARSVLFSNGREYWFR